jgi:DNA-binding NarL/FixJ family response regulator
MVNRNGYLYDALSEEKNSPDKIRVIRLMTIRLCQSRKERTGEIPVFDVLAESQDGEEVIRLVRDLAPNLVLMDIGMPKINGLKATGKLKLPVRIPLFWY